MTLRYLLDTDIVSAMMVNPDGVAAQRATQRMADPAMPQLCTSVVVQCELAFGLEKRPSARLRKALDVQLGALIVLPLDEEVAAHYASLRSRLEALGQPIGPNDMLKAAHALALDATLVSADAEFLRVPGLRVENWLKPLE